MDKPFAPSYYVCADFSISPIDPWRDLLAAELGELGFESFEETAKGLKAWIPEEMYQEGSLNHVLELAGSQVQHSHTTQRIQNENWNAEWEKNFNPISVDDLCYIRAPFHSPGPDGVMEIVIHPQMSFGTGHHATTFLMVRRMFSLDLNGKMVLDMGSGTGILAILAEKRGAEEVDAIDIDEWSYENMPQNFELNDCTRIQCYMGGKELLDARYYDVILANINRNILLDQMELYAGNLNPGGDLLLSGFYENDVEVLLEAALPLGLELVGSDEQNRWTMLHLRKTSDS
ncbi:MAG: 50S ribosomal protein L11 methyltransferase [Flavobacteriales bacterium]|nr:50S ribosomal protein L11 methyltransferase [Flavobacteriales bacterium]